MLSSEESAVLLKENCMSIFCRCTSNFKTYIHKFPFCDGTAAHTFMNHSTMWQKRSSLVLTRTHHPLQAPNKCQATHQPNYRQSNKCFILLLQPVAPVNLYTRHLFSTLFPHQSPHWASTCRPVQQLVWHISPTIDSQISASYCCSNLLYQWSSTILSEPIHLFPRPITILSKYLSTWISVSVTRWSHVPQHECRIKPVSGHGGEDESGN